MVAFNVLSFDADKVCVEETAGGLVVCKKTSHLEYRQICEAKRWLSNCKTNLVYEDRKYEVVLPKDVSWIEETDELRTSFCEGANFEAEIIESAVSTRNKRLVFAKAFLSWMKEAGFLWKDSSPRNILVDHDNRVISIVDFERPLVLAKAVTSQEFDTFLIGTVHEEFSCFFLGKEVEELFPTIWNRLGSQKRFQVTSTRQRKLIETVYGITDNWVSSSIYTKTARMMSEAATPFILDDGQVFYPAFALEELKGGQRYVDAVLSLLQVEESERLNVLRRKLGVQRVPTGRRS
jgi:serine/threonine protein kinase